MHCELGWSQFTVHFFVYGFVLELVDKLDSKSSVREDVWVRVPSELPMGEIVLTFKKMMHEPMLIEGSGNYEKLSEVLGESNAERLRKLGIVKVNRGNFSLTTMGKKFIEVFNSK